MSEGTAPLSPAPTAPLEPTAPPVHSADDVRPPGAVVEPAAPSPGGIPNWATLRESLSPELRDSPWMQTHTSLEDFARTGIEQNRMVGMDKIPRPNAESSEEDWAVFHDAMGRPKAAHEYNFGDWQPPENIRQGYDMERQSRVLEIMHRFGLSNAAATGIVREVALDDANMAQARGEQLQKLRADTEQKLAEAWGSALPARTATAKTAMDYIFGENVDVLTNVALPDGKRLGDHPAMIEAMYFIGQKMTEAKIIGETNVTEPSLSPAEASKQAAEMESNPDIAAQLATGDKNNVHVKRWSMLYDFAHPEERVG